MGLEHYLNSLAQVLPRAHKAKWALGGHEGAIDDLAVRINEIAQVHHERLKQILSILDEPLTLHELTHELFPVTEGYHRLLAIEEAGAHVEYLLMRGYIAFSEDSNRIRHFSRLDEIKDRLPGFNRFFVHLNSVQAPDLSNVRRVKAR
jgi:hypothetical protein